MRLIGGGGPAAEAGPHGTGLDAWESGGALGIDIEIIEVLKCTDVEHAGTPNMWAVCDSMKMSM